MALTFHVNHLPMQKAATAIRVSDDAASRRAAARSPAPSARAVRAVTAIIRPTVNHEGPLVMRTIAQGFAANVFGGS